MSTVHAQIEIDAPLQRVWDTVMDPSRLGEWVTIHRGIRDAPLKPLREGATMDQQMQVRGLRFQVHWTLVSVAEPTWTTISSEGRCPTSSATDVLKVRNPVALTLTL